MIILIKNCNTTFMKAELRTSKVFGNPLDSWLLTARGASSFWIRTRFLGDIKSLNLRWIIRNGARLGSDA